MNNLQKVGGVSCILFAVALTLGLILITPPFAAMSPEAMQADNVAARLAYIASVSRAQSQLLWIGFALEVIAGGLLFAPLLALFATFKEQHYGRAALALGLGTLGIPFFIISHLPRFSLLQAAQGYAHLDVMQKAARAAAYGYAEGSSAVSEPIFWAFLAAALIILAPTMRHARFAARSSWVGVAAGVLGLISTVGALTIPALGFVSVLSLVLLVIWSVGTGLALVRSAG